MYLDNWKRDIIVSFIKKGLEEHNTPHQVGEMLVVLLWILDTEKNLVND